MMIMIVVGWMVLKVIVVNYSMDLYREMAIAGVIRMVMLELVVDPYDVLTSYCSWDVWLWVPVVEWTTVLYDVREKMVSIERQVSVVAVLLVVMQHHHHHHHHYLSSYHGGGCFESENEPHEFVKGVGHTVLSVDVVVVDVVGDSQDHEYYHYYVVFVQ